MQKRTFLTIAAGAALAAAIGIGTASAHHDIKIGVVGPKTGPLAAGAAITHFPSFKLWAHEINEAGGLKLKDGRHKIKLIVYDDRTNPGETIKAIQRLATQDKADFIMAPYGTGFNLATAPIFDKYGYPQIALAAVSDKVDALVKRFPNLFFVNGTTTQYASTAVNVLKKLKDEGKINNRVAVVNVGDTFGIELANAGRPLFKAAGFDIVYDKSYPLGTQDLAPVIKGAKASNPDSFVAWSYPPDTFGLAEQAKIEGLNVKVYYSAVATAFQGFGKKFGKSAEGIIGAGGIRYSAELREYYKRMKKVTGVDVDFWGSPNYYATLQAIKETFEAVGSMDRKAFTKYMKTHTYNTIMGLYDLRNQKLNQLWTVGQWQNGDFNGVAGIGIQGAKPVMLKKGW